MPPTVAPRPQLLTYPDSLGGDLGALADLLDGPLAGLFQGVHVLPPFPSSGDRGFAPLTYDRIDPRFGDWDDLRRIAASHDLLLDLMINHISRQSHEFQDFVRHGRQSAFADLFITIDKIWPDGQPVATDLARIFLRKPGSPFTDVVIEDTGRHERVWTSFGSADWSEQIDLDVNAAATRDLIVGWLQRFAERGVRIVRLDAVGYVIKKPGTTCFMVEPDIHAFLAWVVDIAGSMEIVILPEVHDAYATHEKLSARGFWTYDFVLPGLLLHAFRTGDPRRLAQHLAASPDRQFTNLDCHDGIPVRPDLDGIVAPDEMAALADEVLGRGGNVNHILSEAHAEAGDIHQLNCTYYSALGEDDERYLAARAIQLFAKGVPQIYYVGLLAGANDHDAVARLGEGREINRHNYTPHELRAAMERPIVGRIMDLVRLRNEHPAFEGDLSVEPGTGRSLRLLWRHGAHVVSLDVDFNEGCAAVTDGTSVRPLARWATATRGSAI